MAGLPATHKVGERTSMSRRNDGYRVGRTFWGRTIIIEAAQAKDVEGAVDRPSSPC